MQHHACQMHLTCITNIWLLLQPPCMSYFQACNSLAGLTIRSAEDGTTIRESHDICHGIHSSAPFAIAACFASISLLSCSRASMALRHSPPSFSCARMSACICCKHEQLQARQGKTAMHGICVRLPTSLPHDARRQVIVCTAVCALVHLFGQQHCTLWTVLTFRHI